MPQLRSGTARQLNQATAKTPAEETAVKPRGQATRGSAEPKVEAAIKRTPKAGTRKGTVQQKGGAGAPPAEGAVAEAEMKKDEGQAEKDKQAQEKKDDEASNAPLPEKVYILISPARNIMPVYLVASHGDPHAGSSRRGPRVHRGPEAWQGWFWTGVHRP